MAQLCSYCLFVLQDNNIKMIDFGAAIPTGSKTFVSSPGYNAPEHAKYGIIIIIIKLTSLKK